MKIILPALALSTWISILPVKAMELSPEQSSPGASPGASLEAEDSETLNRLQQLRRGLYHATTPQELADATESLLAALLGKTKGLPVRQRPLTVPMQKLILQTIVDVAFLLPKIPFVSIISRNPPDDLHINTIAELYYAAKSVINGRRQRETVESDSISDSISDPIIATLGRVVEVERSVLLSKLNPLLTAAVTQIAPGRFLTRWDPFFLLWCQQLGKNVRDMEIADFKAALTRFLSESCSGINPASEASSSEQKPLQALCDINAVLGNSGSDRVTSGVPPTSLADIYSFTVSGEIVYHDPLPADLDTRVAWLISNALPSPIKPPKS